ncbi:MAG: bifunctional demethylmenaquinone methyltransferase/2-methoxy-6-polyprenyl-1,4-benzoquinol methylase UbiE [Marinilabiliaceae bacterium]|nr:bifunctional demethylmenaquinone methyltransferase/2-methoxy-6-polyprenyl-1,4-benzoquinol methylase UbiE [Marinilabiliaceae bacterium]
MTVKPYNNAQGNKKKQVAIMFDNIAPKYDLLNHLLSLGIDKIWRRNAIQLLKHINSPKILDVATGTGDLAIALNKKLNASVVGLDLSNEMLQVAKEKVLKLNIRDVELVQGDSENLPFADNTFDAVTVAFGVRNFENLKLGLKEMKRVLKPSGKMVILEFSKPKYFPMKQLYNFYFSVILPMVGGLISKDKAAYTYLPESVKHFPQDLEFINVLEGIGMNKVSQKRETFGIATIYFSEK